ncbi:MAG: phosphate butyryltransferase [Kiritimatiellae bacterium]|nr:phosphate butyryltransferase [Kiritimatiellia bacterium]
MKIERVRDILDAVARSGRKWRLSVACAQDAAVLEAVAEACRHGFAEAALYGRPDAVGTAAEAAGLKLGDALTVAPADTEADAVRGAVAAIHEGRADVLVKGRVSTANLLRAVLSRELGMRAGRLLSHVAVFDAPRLNRLMLLTDAGINITPNVQRKVAIVENAVKVARALGIERPRVAMLAAVDTLNYPAMEATLEAALVAKIVRSGVVAHAVVDGPFALDNAVSPAAAAKKHRKGDVAGRADILCAPEIETANVLYKALQCFCDVTFAGVVMGASKPLAVASRSDSPASKLMTIALACYLSE